MSICSDVGITREDARAKVKKLLMYDQEKLIDAAIKGMQDFDLEDQLNKDNYLYYYTIEKKKKVKNE